MSKVFLKYSSKNRGFTLIELSIVLVIIGLIVGGILVGQDLINAATMRSQIAQIEKYQSALNTFRNKYGGLPGDLNNKLASQFGLTPRAGSIGRGDGNGEMDGFFNGTAGASFNQNGENLLFWEDLSAAGYVEGKFSYYIDGLDGNCYPYPAANVCTLYFPLAKIGGGNFVYTYSGYAAGCCSALTGIGPNFFGIAIIQAVGGSSVSSANNAGGPTTPGFTVIQAYNIDKKIDDGLPTTGHVLAQYLTDASGGAPGWSTNGATPTSSTCYDTSSGHAAYSTSYTGGTNMNCGMSFQFSE